MTHDTLVARVRGLGTRSLGELAGLPSVLEERLRDRSASELAILARWGGDAVVPIELDEDRRTLRAIARGLVANIAPSQRIAGAVATRSITRRHLGTLANATTFAEVRALLADHPLAAAFDETELFEVERVLARRCFASTTRVRDRAFVAYREQLVDLENAEAALLLAARGGDLVREDNFLDGGRRVDRKTFVASCVSLDAARELLSRAFARTPFATALFAPSPSAIEDAALAWQLATQARWRRMEPLGLAPLLYFVLHRRDEARHLRRTAWRAALGGAA